jgi:hypothetical protein
MKLVVGSQWGEAEIKGIGKRLFPNSAKLRNVRVTFPKPRGLENSAHGMASTRFRTFEATVDEPHLSE